MKKIKLILSFLTCVLILSCSTTFDNIMAKMPNLSLKADGIYRGKYILPNSPLNATVDVTVNNHSLTEINLIEHNCSPIGKKAEKITDIIIENQSLDVDAVSGATASSKTILKAVENALQ